MKTVANQLRRHSRGGGLEAHLWHPWREPEQSDERHSSTTPNRLSAHPIRGSLPLRNPLDFHAVFSGDVSLPTVWAAPYLTMRRDSELSELNGAWGTAAPMISDESEANENSSVSLSARERTIVFLMGHGLSNKMIARKLSIAPETVKSHAKRIFMKLTVQSRAQAVYRASMLGLI